MFKKIPTTRIIQNLWITARSLWIYFKARHNLFAWNWNIRSLRILGHPIWLKPGLDKIVPIITYYINNFSWALCLDLYLPCLLFVLDAFISLTHAPQLFSLACKSWLHHRKERKPLYCLLVLCNKIRLLKKKWLCHLHEINKNPCSQVRSLQCSE